MKRLVQLRHGDTIYSALEKAFSHPPALGEDCLVQVSRSVFKYAPIDPAKRFDITYRQMWLFAIREYREMPAEQKKRLAGSQSAHANETVLFDFGTLADKYGFSSNEIQALLQRDPDREISRRLLRTAREPSQYMYENFEDVVTQVVDAISKAKCRT